MARKERESDSRRENKWQTCWCCRGQQRVCRMAQASAEKLQHTGPAEKKRVASVPQREQLARTPEPPLPKGRAVCLEYKIMRRERVKVGESATLATERRIRAGAWRGKDRLHGEERKTPRKKRRASKKSLPSIVFVA